MPVVPIYIQEKILPQAIIENLRETARKGEPEPELTLFNDFDGIPFQELVEFYRHEQNWANRMILGDSLLVMTSLAEKEGLKGKVQMIYMDPPYGIKFGSNWQVSTRKRDVKDGKAEDATRQPEQIKAFRDTWELGIHSYLAYLRDRLTVARELLTESGSIFVQIGDENVHLVRCVMDEVFGSECEVVTILVKKKGSQKSGLLDPVNDYLLWYSKTSRHVSGGTGIKYRQLFEQRDLDAETLGEFRWVELSDGRQFDIGSVPGPDGSTLDYRLRPQQLFHDHPGVRLFRPWPITNGGYRKNQSVPFELDGKVYTPPKGRCWSHTAQTDDGSIAGMRRLALADRLIGGETIDYKRYLDDAPYKILSNWWDRLGGAPDQVYVVQTNTEIAKRCILMSTDPGDLVLDPTCGSGTTAYVAEQWGRRWITVDTSRVALALARARLMAGTFPYYLLADSKAGAVKQAAAFGQAPSGGPFREDVRRGFVLRRASAITSTSYATCSAIREGMSRAAIDAAIRRHADTELLYDQPYEDPSRIRVTGPFTVESLSPHRVLAGDVGIGPTAPDGPAGEAPPARDAADFVAIILDNLRKAGVQNTFKNERLVFESIEPYAGTYIHAVGEYTDASGKTLRAAISVGPEYGTVDADWVKEAAKEARKGEGFPMLVVCAFAFDPYVGEEARQWPNLTILITRMNPDLAMDTGDQKLLKSTGAGNLFMVFGEPDLELRTLPDGKLQVELRGLDVYDPTSGEIRSDTTDEIACWFIDTNYNEESFFVRHAYFTGADEPYKKLQRALKAEIDEAAWASLYSTVSRPFDPPSTGKIAVKVINHYGDEVLKVYEAAQVPRL